MSQQPFDRPWYIVVEGAIGVGKTTLARMLRNYFQTGLILEVFEENPFLAKFYQDRPRYAFQTQMFFLLSRYRQQKQNIQPEIRTVPLVADYMFAKDWLFAQLNLAGDEWEVYRQIHAALTEQIPAPDLIVYLQADTDVLMARIAQRDRPYERDMDRGYIDALRQVYEEYFSRSSLPVPVLTIDTNPLNFVSRPDDFKHIVDRLRSVLQEGSFQQHLPQFEPGLRDEGAAERGHLLGDLQRFHAELDRVLGAKANVYVTFMRLSEQVGRLGGELAQLWSLEETQVAQRQPASLARQSALSQRGSTLESGLADCMAYLLKLSEYAGIDLERACEQKLEILQNHTDLD